MSLVIGRVATYATALGARWPHDRKLYTSSMCNRTLPVTLQPPPIPGNAEPSR
jgi:hypothetical protein